MIKVKQQQQQKEKTTHCNKITNNKRSKTFKSGTASKT